MKAFLKDRSYDMVKMFLNQFATAIFGLSLAFAAGLAKRPVLRNVTSAFSILFYMFLLYTMTWEIGFKDKISVYLGKKPKKPLTGLWISLGANVPNLLFAVMISLGMLFGNASFFGTLGTVGGGAAIFLEGMYTGLLANSFLGNPLNSYWWVYFLITIPAMITSGVAYYLGLRDIKFTSLFDVVYPESDRDPKRKKK